jgi:putative oxidoreductase
MKFKEMPSWAHHHFAYFLDIVRIYLGIGLVVKGISFLTHGGPLLGALNGSWAPLATSVPFIQIVGGLFLAAGIFTRVAAFVLMPVLCGALFLVHWPNLDTLNGREGVEFSGLVLFLLALIFVHGAGPLALGRRMRRREPSSRQLWLDAHTDIFADLIRIYLGAGLFIKGLYIMHHHDQLLAIMNGPGNMPFWLMAAAHYVIPAHFVGGVLLALGLLTRPAAIAQIPPLVAAIFYAFLPGFASLEMRQSFEFTTLVLFLLTMIAVFGEGRLAFQHEREEVGLRDPAMQRIPS